jgi:hypothetical protein
VILYEDVWVQLFKRFDGFVVICRNHVEDARVLEGMMLKLVRRLAKGNNCEGSLGQTLHYKYKTQRDVIQEEKQEKTDREIS